MSLRGRPACDLCGGLCDDLTDTYDCDSQADYKVCPDCLEIHQNLVTDERIAWGPIANHPLNED